MWGTANAKSVTIQFWVKSSITGTFAFTIASSNGDQDIAKEYTISSANTWEKKTFTVSQLLEHGTSGTSAFGYIVWGLCGVLGSSRETSNIDSWGTGTGGASVTVTANSTNALATTSGATWQITGIQIESNDTATPFEHIKFSEELRACQRYYIKSYDYDDKPGTANPGAMFDRMGLGTSYSNRAVQIRYPTDMRAEPTVTIYSLSGVSGATSDCGTGYTEVSTDSNAQFNGTLPKTGLSKLTNNNADSMIGFHYTSDAEL